jgi:hypothetical protein
MEEVNIRSHNNENEFLEMADHFKKSINKKNKELNKLKKLICCLYGLCKATDDNYDDMNLIEVMRGYLSDAVEELLGIDPDD